MSGPDRFRSAVRVITRLLFAVKYSAFPGINQTRLPRLRRVIQHLDTCYKAPFIENVIGHKLHLDPHDSLGLSVRGSYEPFQTRLLQQRIRTGSVVLDIGALIGYYTLLFAKAAGPTGRVYAFEPEPHNYALLGRNVEINGYQNVTLVNRAVTDRTGSVRLFISEENSGDHRSYASSDDRESIEIQSVALDDYFRHLDIAIDVVKMDIQGGEYHALTGMQSLLSRSPSVTLATEFWPHGLSAAGIDPVGYLSLLFESGFLTYEIDETKKALRYLELSHATDRDRLARSGSMNLLCSKVPIPCAGPVDR